MFEELLSSDAGGTCITPEGLDLIWPLDDSDAAVVVGKGLRVPHTCGTVESCHEAHGQQACLEFAFGGPSPEVVSLPGAGPLLAAAILTTFIIKRRSRRQ